MLNILCFKILSLALIMLAGFGLVRWGPLSSEDTRSLSKINCWLIMPCSIFGAFQMERSPEILKGLLLVLLAALLVHGLYILLSALLKKPLKLTPVDQASAFCTNAGNLIIPLVTAALGKQWVIYTCAYILVQTVLLWSYVKNLVCGEKGIAWKQLFLNPNILALLAGCTLFLLNLQLPRLLRDTIFSIGSMVGPSSMLVIGMTIAASPLGKALLHRRILMTAGLRLLIYPACCLALLKALCLIFPDGGPYFLITMLAASAPSAALITHICQLYGREAGYASSVCTVTTALCTLTIPLMIQLYTLFCL